MSIREPLERDVIRYFSEVAGRVRSRLERDLRRAAPVKTGAARNATTVSVRREGRSGFRLTARCAVEHASFTSQPTRPHVIRPVHAKALRFYWPVVGSIVYFARVNHPGTRGTGWWERTLETFDDVIRDSF